ncbi:unnamed protein product [Heligmosomoides polygyrus]|uniref:Protein tweety homolog n=1 Tax=Heligmosomoides polygyrus TaxID=6339 RepID=A0A183G5B2_HELPZ|nr:unnamed protein product [Heligmosomoides polygyrus]
MRRQSSLDSDAFLEFTNSALSYYAKCLTGDEVVSSDSGKELSTSIFYDVVQALVALWTCVFSLLYSYAWRQHRKKFIMSIFFVVPTVFTVCCVISGLLATIVVLGRIFSTPIAYKDFLNMREKMLNRQDSVDYSKRQRSYSGTSSVSVTSEDYLPKPLCRRHSVSHNSLCSRPPSVSRKYSYAYSHYNACDSDEEEQN